MKFPPFFFCLFFTAVVVVSNTFGADENREQIKFFENSIRPLLANHCFECHSDAEQEGGLRLDHISFIREGGDSGPAIDGTDIDTSMLLKAVRYEDGLEMPPSEQLEDDQIALLQRWINMGAPWPNEEVVNRADRDAHGFTAEDRQWWAIQPVTDPEVPTTGDGWAINPIDRFVSRKLGEAELSPAAPADRYELVRRAYFDMHGLPPTREQVDAFVHDPSPDAWPRLIDQLLESPRYGERWAQHWLDVVRYAESDGYRQDAFRPDASRYRDYVIASLNDDKPYDQFTREQLAGDEFNPDDPDVLIGTAFLRHGIYEYNQRNARMHWELIVNEMTNVTGEVFLGLGIGCAQCHDHKFDPILQKDYYALQAFLASTCWPTEMPLVDAQQKQEHDAMLAQWEQETASIRERIDTMLAPTYAARARSVIKQFPEDIQAMCDKPADQRTTYEQQMVMLVERQIDRKSVDVDGEKAFAKKPEQLAEFKALLEQLKAFDHLKPKPLPTGFVATDVGTEPAPTFMQTRTGKQVVEPAFLTLLNEPLPKIEPTETTTGRRRALAQWVASPTNPLSTRVIVNRLWQYHFGRGIVATPNDVGMLGEPPSHPDLLDWLTSRFIEGGWKMKPIHRMIMLSATYQQTARHEPSKQQSLVDPENRLLWRFEPFRLDAEQIRDGMLAASGELTQRLGGASVSGDSTVRSIYVKKIRNTPDPQLGKLDAPMGFESAPTRPQTTTPTQSLTLVNGDWTLKRATAMAKSLLGGKQSISATEIEEAYWRLFARQPSDDEIDMTLRFVDSILAEPLKPAETSKPEDKFPSETGLRPISSAFADVTSAALGDKALWIQPESRFERLQLPELSLEGDFTIEAVATLDRIYSDASVSTLISSWNSNNKTPGWSLGITSAKSGYQPRNFIMQLIGENAKGEITYEVVASDLRFPLNKPVYLAATVHSNGADSSPTVTFFMKDLSDPQAKMQTAIVKHSIVSGIHNNKLPLLVGGRTGIGHQWDGQIARLALSKSLLTEQQLFVNAVAEGGPVARTIDFDFSTGDGEKPAPETFWMREQPAAKSSQPPSAIISAVADLCHALMTSNEFLYLH